MMRHARRPPYPRTQQNTTTLPLRTRPTNINNLNYTTPGQTRTQLTSTDTEVRRWNHRQQRDGTHANENDNEAAQTTAHQPHRSCSRDLTVNRPHASRPTPNQPGVHGSKRERRPTGWRHCGAPRPPTTIPTNETECRDSTITQPTVVCKLRRTMKRPTDRPQRPTSNPRPPGTAQPRPSQEA